VRGQRVIDLGCGEGRFCRMLKALGIEAIGIDPTEALIQHARQQDPEGDYRIGRAEALDFPERSYDLVVSYLTLIDIPDIRVAISEMCRVLAPAGTLLIANLTSFNTACFDTGWIKGGDGRRLYYPIDNYLEERSMWTEYRGIRIRNHHRDECRSEHPRQRFHAARANAVPNWFGDVIAGQDEEMEKECEPESANLLRFYLNNFREDSFHRNDEARVPNDEGMTKLQELFVMRTLELISSFLSSSTRQALPLPVRARDQLSDAIVGPAAAT
jgi:ubiquinone/menaquinone biosynthesis C-methylase UbiE